jgi:hypothetical protein
MNLEELAIKYGTDKQCANGHGYTIYYEKYFNCFRNNEIKLMELGVREGWSINMWAEYFPNGEFWGIDNNKEGLCPTYFDNEKIHFYIGSQDDEVFLKNVCKDKKFDIIIDDCSHISKLSIKSFEILFSFLKSGGIYVIEDLHVCELLEYNPDNFSTISYLKNLIRNDVKSKDIFLNKIVFMEKI